MQALEGGGGMVHWSIKTLFKTKVDEGGRQMVNWLV